MNLAPLYVMGVKILFCIYIIGNIRHREICSFFYVCMCACERERETRFYGCWQNFIE